jgi:hypothetical protein
LLLSLTIWETYWGSHTPPSFCGHAPEVHGLLHTWQQRAAHMHTWGPYGAKDANSTHVAPKGGLYEHLGSTISPNWPLATHFVGYAQQQPCRRQHMHGHISGSQTPYLTTLFWYVYSTGTDDRVAVELSAEMVFKLDSYSIEKRFRGFVEHHVSIDRCGDLESGRAQHHVRPYRGHLFELGLVLHHVRPYRGHLFESGLALLHVRLYRGHVYESGHVDPHAGVGGVCVNRSVRQRYPPRQELDRARWLLEFRPPAVPAMQHPHISLASVIHAGHFDPWRTLDAVSVNRHIAQHACYRQVSLDTLYSTHPFYIYTMGWNSGKGKGSWNQGNGGNGSSPGNDSGQDGTGSARYAYSQLYKEREKLREVQEAMRKKEEKEERAKELAQFKEELAAAKKGNSVEDSIYASMIGDCPNGEKKKEEPASQSMVSSMMKMLRRLTGSKKSNDKKRPRSSSRSSSSSSSKKHKNQKR